MLANECLHQDYVHQIGRTGRSGKTGIATTFVNMQTAEQTLLDLKYLLMEAKQKCVPGAAIGRLQITDATRAEFLHSSRPSRTPTRERTACWAAPTVVVRPRLPGSLFKRWWLNLRAHQVWVTASRTAQSSRRISGGRSRATWVVATLGVIEEAGKRCRFVVLLQGIAPSGRRLPRPDAEQKRCSLLSSRGHRTSTRD